ncbi:hypothetical protein M9H77_21457 [Catharanthus roseus]|uniref:Uncharacterized protein n=1 Tax=Catharanthus roseus TaxID=4058 RepID=A0ACC0ANI4_CATRO|nr:hypothetical protein M9H77_21457 [Catharanthus roseus]
MAPRDSTLKSSSFTTVIEPKRMLQGAHCALRFETISISEIVTLEKTKEEQAVQLFANPLFILNPPPPMAECTMVYDLIEQIAMNSSRPDLGSSNHSPAVVIFQEDLLPMSPCELTRTAPCPSNILWCRAKSHGPNLGTSQDNDLSCNRRQRWFAGAFTAAHRLVEVGVGVGWWWISFFLL